MTDMKPINTKKSLLERADQRFDFGSQQLRKVDPETLAEGPVLEGRPARRTPQPRAPKRVTGTSAAADAVQADVTRTDDAAATESAQPAADGVEQPPASPARETGLVGPAATTAIAPKTARKALALSRFVPTAPQQTIDRARLSSNGFIDAGGAIGPLAEEYRIIKRQLLRNASVPQGRRVLVSSAQPAEGKTFTTINLALSLAAEHELSVVLVDGDFTRQQIPEMMGVTPGPGLLDALADPDITLSDCVIPTDIPELMILPAGRSTPRDTELINSTRMLDLFATLEADAPDRLILIDSMPLLASSSAGAFAQLCGQVLVVVRADVTREAALRDAIGLIGQHHGISLLLNRVRFTPGGRRFGSYYGEGG